MLEIHKKYILDENNQLIAVQIPITEFDQIEEILANFGLIELMAEAEDNDRLTKDEAWKDYQSLKCGKLNIQIS